MRRAIALTVVLMTALASPAAAEDDAVTFRVEQKLTMSLKSEAASSGYLDSLYIVKGTRSGPAGEEEGVVFVVALVTTAPRGYELKWARAYFAEIDPEAFTMDLLGNSATFRAELTPISRQFPYDYPDTTFDLTFSRPSSFVPRCLTDCVGLWPGVDVDARSAGVWTGSDMPRREGYRVRGTFAGRVLPEVPWDVEVETFSRFDGAVKVAAP